MGLLTVLTIVTVGLAVGLLAGLVGIGGGVLIVPFLYFFYGHPELFGVVVADDVRTVLAHGTSLFVILPTSAWGAFVYHQKKLVAWRAAIPIGLVSMAAAAAGARLALFLPPEALKLMFSMLLIFSGVRMGLKRPPEGELPAAGEPRVTLVNSLVIGGLVGLLSALLGVGGGIIAIPLLIRLARVDIRRVAATSMGIIAITAAAGSISYMLSGADVTGLPSGSIGLVHLPAAAAMFVGSFVSVQWGASLNQKLAPRTLGLIFAILFIVVGLRLAITSVAALT